jgi:hypothetical protein|tara:strand:- start:154 stop:330 length:177 start_codon:yes stop_codon:yes gene_type:complete
MGLLPVVRINVLATLDSGGSSDLTRFLVLVDLLGATMFISEETFEKALLLNYHFPAFL